MIARQLTHLAGEMHAAIGQQDFRFADAAGVENDLAGRRIAGVVLVRDAEIEIAERHPDPLAAPADVDGLAFERHRLAERRTGLRRQLLLETRPEREVSGMDNQLAHLSNLAVGGSGGRIQPELATRSKERSNLPPNLAAAILAPRGSIAGDLARAALLVRLPSIK